MVVFCSQKYQNELKSTKNGPHGAHRESYFQIGLFYSPAETDLSHVELYIGYVVAM